ncbi:MAG: hypothetical protein J6W52_04800 [Bacteroidaceae bacterium]|nr:hypothetical protein [Bacteroidaceae bacterium]
MKKIILTLWALIIGTAGMKAQNDCIIPMMVLVPQQVDSLAPMAQSKLESRIRQIVTQNGMDGGALFSNFSIVANLVEGSKEVMGGTRPLVTLTSELELYVGNNYTGDKFASTSVVLNGAGRNESKAYSTAFGSINANNAQIQKFLRDAKRKMNEYYETQIPNIIRQAKSFSTRREYEEALCLLTSVPTCCSKYNEIERCMLDIYQEYVDYDCAVKVNKARSIWNASQDKEGATLAGAYLASIDPSSSCWDEALVLAESIRARIGDKWEFSKELMRESVMLEKAKIEAIRAIGVAFGQNQKALTVRENWLIR